MKKCSVDICDRDVGAKGARGLCSLHYQRLLRTGDVMAGKPPEQKKPFGRRCKIDNCQNQSHAWDMCQKHYIRAKTHGSPNATHERYMRKRRWLEANANHIGDDCLKWPFSVSAHGRGTVTVDGKTMPAPRYMCILASGQPPSPKHHAAHTCGKGHEGCVNPKHLVWKTPKENEADKVDHGTLRRGTAINTNKLNESDVRCIRELLAFGTSGVEIAKMYGITPAMVSNIKTRKAWDWLD